MVTPVLAVASGTARTGASSALAIVEAVVIVSWIVFFAVLLIFGAIVYTSRSASRRRSLRRRANVTAVRRAGREPAGLGQLRRADPHFDEQLLLDAALTATMLVFAATSTGDITPISRLVTDAFWETPFGSLLRTMARDQRRENAQQAKDAARGRASKRWNIPLDYHPSVPELAAVDLGAQQQVSVRVSFHQLQAIVRAGAAEFAAGAAAPNFALALASVGKGVAAEANDRRARQVSWVAAGGRYDLTFVRPAGGQTDPSAALADRTCKTCGATYRSELAISCAHCQALRSLPWGDWRLAAALPVR
jgi:hypothetical protein